MATDEPGPARDQGLHASQRPSRLKISPPRVRRPINEASFYGIPFPKASENKGGSAKPKEGLWQQGMLIVTIGQLAESKEQSATSNQLLLISSRFFNPLLDA